MAVETMANAKLAQYLIEAYGKEKELEASLQAHIGMTNRDAYKKRLEDHLKETKQHGRMVERRLKKLDASAAASTITEVARRGVAAAKKPLQAVRGSSTEEKELKNAKSEYSYEHEEIATYTAIETLAEEIGDEETAKMARQIRREEERMARFLEGKIPVLARAVARAEIPSSERATSGGRRRRASSSKRGSGTRSRASTRGKSTARRSRSRS